MYASRGSLHGFALCDCEGWLRKPGVRSASGLERKIMSRVESHVVVPVVVPEHRENLNQRAPD